MMIVFQFNLHAVHREENKHKQVIALKVLDVSQDTRSSLSHSCRLLELGKIAKLCPWLESLASLHDPLLWLERFKRGAQHPI